MPTMAPTVTVTPVTSTSNTATKTRTTTITAATSSQPPSTFKEPIDLLPNYIPKGNTNSTWERSPYSTPMARKRPASNTLSESSKVSSIYTISSALTDCSFSQRPKPLDAEFYNEYMFVSKSSIKKYQCIHCKKIPKRFFRCKCGKVDEKQESKGRARFDGNTCNDCKIYPCTNCGQSDQYEPDKVTNSNIGKLKVFCENKCGENITLVNLENRSHVRNKCSKRKRSCKYTWAGCTHEGTGDEIEKHEKKSDVHVLAAIEKLHKENLELRKDNSDLKKDNLDLSKRIKMIEAKLNPGSSGPLTTQPAIISQLRI